MNYQFTQPIRCWFQCLDLDTWTPWIKPPFQTESVRVQLYVDCFLQCSQGLLFAIFVCHHVFQGPYMPLGTSSTAWTRSILILKSNLARSVFPLVNLRIVPLDLSSNSKFQDPSSSLGARLGLTSSNPFHRMSQPCSGKTSAQSLVSSLHLTLAVKIVYELCDRRYQRTCWETDQPRVRALSRKALDGIVEGKEAFGCA